MYIIAHKKVTTFTGFLNDGGICSSIPPGRYEVVAIREDPIYGGHLLVVEADGEQKMVRSWDSDMTMHGDMG